MYCIRMLPAFPPPTVATAGEVPLYLLAQILDQPSQYLVAASFGDRVVKHGV